MPSSGQPWQAIAVAATAISLSHKKLRYHIVPRRAQHDRAHAEAMRQFFAQGLDKTERYAEIVADSGINEKITP